MPPIRTLSTPAKPMRTERSHEENQERAYIAASRRSDRSLEARVESARRASEIHKKRTGRSLRVREEDVLNEEMYEEEDDDLPMQFRRLSALNPGGFHERLSSYMTTQVGMRAALHQAIYQANQYNSANSYLNAILQSNGLPVGNGMSMMPSMMPQQNWQGLANQANPATPHSQSASVATPNETTSSSTPAEKQQHLHISNTDPTTSHMRTMSMPMPFVASSPQNHSQPPTPQSLIGAKLTQSPMQVPSPPESKRGSSATPKMTPQQALSPLSLPANANAQITPLTTQLPAATQQLLDATSLYPHMWQSGPSPDAFDASQDQNPYSHIKLEPPTSDMKASNRMYSYSNLNQTLSRGAYDPYHQLSNTSLPIDPAQDLDFKNAAAEIDNSELYNDTLSWSGYGMADVHDASANFEPVWNPDEFVDYQD